MATITTAIYEGRVVMGKCDKCKNYSEKYDCAECKPDYKTTNADNIRSFSDEELADFMYAKDIPWCDDSECPTETLCKDCFRKWLQQEVEEK